MKGAQLVDKAAALLRAASSSDAGQSTAQLAVETGIARPTAHRILVSLQEAGLLDRDSRTGRWYLGPEAFLLGTVAARRYDVTELARPAVRALADETGESAFLSVHRGDETVCVLREEGSFPLRSFVLQEGTRFPLGVASAGLVILSYLPDAEIDAYLARHDLEPRWGHAHTEQALRDRVRRTRRDGYSTNPALILEGSWGMGAAVFDRANRPSWAVSLTGVESRYRQERRKQLGELLLRTAHEVTSRIRTDAPHWSNVVKD